MHKTGFEFVSPGRGDARQGRGRHVGALGYGLIYLFPTQLIYIVRFCVILPFGGALFSQVLPFSRVYYDVRYPQRSEFMMSVQRTLVLAGLGHGSSASRLDC